MDRIGRACAGSRNHRSRHYVATETSVQVKVFKNWPHDQAPHRPTGRGSAPEVAEGAGEIPGGRMAGAEPGVDSAGTQPLSTAEIGRRQDRRSKQAEIEQKETEAGTRRAGWLRRPCGADTGADRGRERMGMPYGDRGDRSPVAHPPIGGVERGVGGGESRASRQPRE